MSDDILQGITSGKTEPTREELMAKLAELTKQTSNQPYLKVGEKGGISVYNLGQRFPVTLYANQWLMLMALATGYSIEDIEGGVAQGPDGSFLPIVEFIEAHRGELAQMPDRKAKAAQNTVERLRDDAIVKATKEFQKAGLSLSEAESKAYETLGLTKPSHIRS